MKHLSLKIEPLRIYNTEEAAILLKFHVVTVSKMCKRGLIKARKAGNWKILGKDILAFVDNNELTINNSEENNEIKN